MPTKFSEFIKRVLKTSTSVIFSGAVLIFLINLITKPSTTETEIQLKEINEKMEVVTSQINDISKNSSDVKSISATTDSIATTTKDIFRSIEKFKSKGK